MALNDVYQLNVNQKVHGVNVVNTYHFQQTIAEAGGEVPEDSLMAAWNLIMSPLQQAMSVLAWNQTCLTARKVRPIGGVQFLNTAGFVGSVAGEGFAANTCCVGRLYSNTASRRGRGRKFLSGLGITAAKAGRLNVSAFNDFVTFLNRLLLAIKVVAETVEFIIRLVSEVDAVIRPVVAAKASPVLVKFKNRQNQVC